MQGFNNLNSINSLSVSPNKDRGSFLYPTLNFTCGGILKAFRIPLLRTNTLSRSEHNIGSRERKLSLKVGIWRQTVKVWHEEHSIELQHESIPPQRLMNIYSIAVKRTSFHIQKGDFVSFKIDDDEQFPFLKRTEDTDRDKFGIPIVSVDFTPSPSEPSIQYNAQNMKQYSTSTCILQQCNAMSTE